MASHASLRFAKKEREQVKMENAFNVMTSWELKTMVLNVDQIFVKKGKSYCWLDNVNCALITKFLEMIWKAA